MPAQVAVGVSLKMYFGHREALEWFARVRERVREHPAVSSGAVELFVIPTYPQLLPAVEAFAGTRVRIGAQDVAAADTGAFTGEVSAAELAEIGVEFAEIGHAERRRLFHETDADTAAKAAAALRNGITPVLCVGETDRLTGADAAAATVAQLERDLEGTPRAGSSWRTSRSGRSAHPNLLRSRTSSRSPARCAPRWMPIHPARAAASSTAVRPDRDC